jgi:hypothetical protein
MNKNSFYGLLLGASPLLLSSGGDAEEARAVVGGGIGPDQSVFALAPILSAFTGEDEGTWKIVAGVDFSSGDYGDSEDTEILYLPLDVSYAQGLWRAKVTVPWLQMKGPGTVIGAGDGGVVDGDGIAEVTTESGLGDVWASLTYSAETFPAEWFYVDVVGKVKFPTADDDKGLGTGEFDGTLQLDFFKPMGQFSPMATVAYKMKGDPDDLELDNVFYLSLGGDYRVNETVNFGATLDFQQAATDSSDDALEVFSYLGYRVSKKCLLNFYGYSGLTDGSPDIGGGLQVKMTL